MPKNIPMQIEHPILMSTAMQQANLAGTKTETRRTAGLKYINKDPDKWNLQFPLMINDSLKIVAKFVHTNGYDKEFVQCPYGKPGDWLWVRENWQIIGWDFDGGEMTVRYQAGGEFTCPYPDPNCDNEWMVKQYEQLIQYDYFAPETEDESPIIPTGKKQPFKPSIHMPKDAARTWLEIVDIKVERLLDITSQSAINEGIEWQIKFPEEYPDLKYWRDYGFDNRFAAGVGFGPIESYLTLFEKINGREMVRLNPWLWVVKYKVLSNTGKPNIS